MLDLDTIVGPGRVAYASWFVSAVVFHRFTHREADEMTFVPMDTQFIEKHIPAKVRRLLLDDLLNAGVVECDGKYWFGNGPGKCYCYRIGEAYRDSPIRPSYITHRILLKKINKYRQHQRDTLKDPVHRTLRDWHDRVEVLPYAPYGVHPSLDVMIDGQRRFDPCEQGRLHTNVSNLQRQFRRYLRLDGRELMSVDISTSQPLLLALLLRNRREIEGKGEGIEGGKRDTVLYSHSCPSSITSFLHDCRTGIVYDRIVELTDYNRDDVKQKFLAVIYGRVEHMDTLVGQAVRQLYPAVYNAVQSINLSMGHGALPRLMQRMESDVMIQRVAGRLLRKRPGMPILTCHDAIIVPPEFVPVVKDTIREEWQAEFGVVPSLNVSSFTAPQAPRQKRKRKRRRPRPVSTYAALMSAESPN
jgi:hypothetical protein